MTEPTIVTCAVTGNITSRSQHPRLPVTPAEIADASIKAAHAGAAIAHIHVRDPETGSPSMEFKYYKEVVDRIRDSNTDLLINLTTGAGGRFVPGSPDPRVAGPGSTLLPPDERVSHVLALKPEICTLDLNTMFSGDSVVINTPSSITRMANLIRDAGVVPELEVFDSGDIHLARKLIAEDVLEGPGLFQIVLGIRYGFAATPETMLYAKTLLPTGCQWAAFGIGRAEFPMVAQAFVLGGHVRVGMEDNLYLARGQLTPDNAALVERAVEIVERLGGSIATPSEARAMLRVTSPIKELSDV